MASIVKLKRREMKYRITLLIGFLCFATFAMAQRTISGVVTDETNTPLIGANVLVKGTTVGTVTDFDGNYTLEVPAEGTELVFSYTGFGTKTVAIDGRTQIDVSMEAGEVLEEVVVTALGITRDEKAVGYAVQEVQGDEIERSNTTGVIDALAGAAAGVQVTSSSGAAGAASRIVLRGQTSFNGDNEALIVVDGFRFNNDENHSERSLGGVANSNRAIDINPNDIASVTVLKGAAATALYGIEGARGVILITTKRGKKEALDISLSTNYTFSEVTNLIALQDEYVQGSGGVWQGPETGQPGSWGPHKDGLFWQQDPDNPYKWDQNGRITANPDPNLPSTPYAPYNNVEDFFQTGKSWTNNLSVGGGSDKTDYRFSFGYTDQEGITPKNEFTRINLGLNIGSSAFNDKLNVRFGANYVNSGGRRIQQGSNVSGVMLGLLRSTPSFDNSNGFEDAADHPESYVFADNTQRNYRGGGGYDNPYWVVNNTPFFDDVNRFFGNFRADWTFNDWAKVTAAVGTDFYTDNRIQQFEIGSRAFPGGQVIEDNYNYRHTDAYFSLSGAGSIANDFTLGYNVGTNLYNENFKNNFIQGDGLSFYGLPKLGNTATKTTNVTNSNIRTIGIYGQLDLGYRDFLYLTFTGRNDWNSTLINPDVEFNAGDIGFFYPSVSLGLVFSELIEFEALSFGKLRASYAEVGGGAPGAYQTTTTWLQPIQAAGTINDVNDGWTNGVGFPFMSTSGFVISGVAGNPFLTPSRTKDIEVGVDLRFFNNRVGLDASYYTRNSEDQIIAINIPNTTGFQRAIVNSGELSTKGYEVVLKLNPVRSRDWNWDIGFNFSTWETLVESLPEGVPNQYLDGFTGSSVYNIAPEVDEDGNIIEKFEFGQIFGGAFQHVNDVNAEGVPIFNPDMPYNPDGALVINDDPTTSGYGFPLVDPNERVIGNPNPDFLLGITNTIAYKNFSLSFLFDIREGGDIWNGTKGAVTAFGMTELTENRGDVVVFPGVNASNGQANSIAVPIGQAWYQGNGGGFGAVSEHYIEDGSFRRLRYVTLSYNLGDVLGNIGLKGLTVSVTGRNLWLDTPYTGFDPELSLVGSSSNGQGLDYFQLPNTKSYSVGLKVNF